MHVCMYVWNAVCLPSLISYAFSASPTLPRDSDEPTTSNPNPSDPFAVDGAHYEGCYADGIPRDFALGPFTSPQMSPLLCHTLCSGYKVCMHVCVWVGGRSCAAISICITLTHSASLSLPLSLTLPHISVVLWLARR